MIHVEHIDAAARDLGVFTPVDGPLSITSVLDALKLLEEKVTADGICVACIMDWTASRGITLDHLGASHSFITGYFIGAHVSIANEQAAKSDPEDDDQIQIWVSNDRCTMMTRYTGTGTVHVATRPTTQNVWGPPVELTRES